MKGFTPLRSAIFAACRDSTANRPIASVAFRLSRGAEGGGHDAS